MPFQTSVNAYATSLPLGVEGDFASANPRASMLAGEGALVVGSVAVIVGRFGFVDANGKVSNTNNAAGTARLGFIPRRGQPVILTDFLQAAGMSVQPGLDITLLDAADVLIRFAAGATIGQKVFANYNDGTAVSGAAGSTPAGGAAFTGSIASSGVLTVASGLTGLVKTGQPIIGSASAGTYVTGQLTGPVGGLGTYSTLPTGQTISSEAMTTKLALESRWFVDSTAGSGELALCSTRS